MSKSYFVGVMISIFIYIVGTESRESIAKVNVTWYEVLPTYGKEMSTTDNAVKVNDGSDVLAISIKVRLNHPHSGVRARLIPNR
jgi:hypothetical protein